LNYIITDLSVFDKQVALYASQKMAYYELND